MRRVTFGNASDEFPDILVQNPLLQAAIMDMADVESAENFKTIHDIIKLLLDWGFDVPWPKFDGEMRSVYAGGCAPMKYVCIYKIVASLASLAWTGWVANISGIRFKTRPDTRLIGNRLQLGRGNNAGGLGLCFTILRNHYFIIQNFALSTLIHTQWVLPTYIPTFLRKRPLLESLIH